MDEILKETDGWEVAAMEDPLMQKWTLMYLIRMCYKTLNFVYGGYYAGSYSIKGNPDWITSAIIPVAKQILGEHQKNWLIADSGADAMMSSASDIGGGGRTWMEQLAFYDPADKKSIDGARAYLSSAV